MKKKNESLRRVCHGLTADAYCIRLHFSMSCFFLLLLFNLPRIERMRYGRNKNAKVQQKKKKKKRGACEKHKREKLKFFGWSEVHPSILGNTFDECLNILRIIWSRSRVARTLTFSFYFIEEHRKQNQIGFHFMDHRSITRMFVVGAKRYTKQIKYSVHSAQCASIYIR